MPRAKPQAKRLVRLEGFDLTKQAFTQFGSKTIAKRLTRNAVASAAQTIVKIVRSLMPNRTGLMKKSVAKKAGQKGWNIWGIVGIDANAKGTDPEGNSYAPAAVDHLVEYGFYNKKTGQHVLGSAPFRKGAEQGLPLANKQMQAKLRANIRKEAKKVWKNRKGKR